MPLVEILFIAVGLAMDAFAVSVAVGASGRARGKRAAFRLSFHFGLFQFIMPLLGWLAGFRIAPVVEAVDHWIAFLLLVFVGYRMIRSAADGDERVQRNPSRGLSLVTLSVATSIDALAIGFGLAMLQVGIWYPSVIIGLVTAALSLIGLALGKRLGRALGKRMELAGGVILILIGLKILVEQLVA
jgi:putative Mn2+ efflux pump MntP